MITSKPAIHDHFKTGQRTSTPDKNLEAEVLSSIDMGQAAAAKRPTATPHTRYEVRPTGLIADRRAFESQRSVAKLQGYKSDAAGYAYGRSRPDHIQI